MGIEYKRIKPRKIYEEVAEILHGMIKRGELKPGDKLDSVQQLAENFQVGRSAIREALSALRAMGLVEMRQGEGTFIKQFDPESNTLSLSSAILMNQTDIIHLLEVRKILEVGSVRSAARNRTDEDIMELTATLEKMRKSFGDEKAGEKADILFHLGIAKASKNPLLIRLMNNVSDIMAESMRELRRIWLYSKETTVERLYIHHEQILQAIIDQDEEKAQELMYAHLEVMEKNLADYYNDSK
jgi:GntR family transcriptional regulator, transcriptional repressor for pyruvate dehydrogenase complex